MSDDLSNVRPPNFSQRYGHEPYPPPLQLDDLDERTRTDLWNYIYNHYLNAAKDRVGREGIWTDFLARYRQYYKLQSLAGALLEIVEREPYNRWFDLIEYLVPGPLSGPLSCPHHTARCLMEIARSRR